MAAAETKLLRWVQRNERMAAALWLGGCAVVLAVLGAWGIAANGAERFVETLDAAWVRELDGLIYVVNRGHDGGAQMTVLRR